MKYKDKFVHCYVRWLALKHLALGWTPFVGAGIGRHPEHRDALMSEFLKSAGSLQRTATHLKVDPRMIPFLDLNPYVWSVDRLKGLVNGTQPLALLLTSNLLNSPVNIGHQTEQSAFYQKVVAWMMQVHQWLPYWSGLPTTWREEFAAFCQSAGAPLTEEQLGWINHLSAPVEGGYYKLALTEWVKFCDLIDINGRVEGSAVQRALEAFADKPCGSRRLGDEVIPMHFHHLGLCDALRYGHYYPLTQKSVPPELVIATQATSHRVGGVARRFQGLRNYWDVPAGEGPNGENPIPLSERMTEFNVKMRERAALAAQPGLAARYAADIAAELLLRRQEFEAKVRNPPGATPLRRAEDPPSKQSREVFGSSTELSDIAGKLLRHQHPHMTTVVDEFAKSLEATIQDAAVDPTGCSATTRSGPVPD